MADHKLVTPPPFVDMLADREPHTAYLEAIEVDSDAQDDTQFGTDFIYCSSHRAVHGTGWCTVRNIYKVALGSTTEDVARDEARALGFPLYIDQVR